MSGKNKFGTADPVPNKATTPPFPAPGGNARREI